MVDRNALEQARDNNDVSLAQEILHEAYRTDVRPFVREARNIAGGAIDPIGVYRKEDIRKKLINKRGSGARATGL